MILMIRIQEQLYSMFRCKDAPSQTALEGMKLFKTIPWTIVTTQELNSTLDQHPEWPLLQDRMSQSKIVLH